MLLRGEGTQGLAHGPLGFQCERTGQQCELIREGKIPAGSNLLGRPDTWAETDSEPATVAAVARKAVVLPTPISNYVLQAGLALRQGGERDRANQPMHCG
jgi:K+/H+ antiporter YhaU regulatory subunit KhtT